MIQQPIKNNKNKNEEQCYSYFYSSNRPTKKMYKTLILETKFYKEFKQKIHNR